MVKLNTLDEINAFITANNVCVIKIGSEFCGPCKLTENNMISVEPQFKNKAAFATVDADECDITIFEKFSFDRIPAVLYFKDGNLARREGFQTVESLNENVNFFIQ